MKITIIEGSASELMGVGIRDLLLSRETQSREPQSLAAHDPSAPFVESWAAPAPSADPAPRPAASPSHPQTPVLGRDFNLSGPNDWGGPQGARSSFGDSPVGDPRADGISGNAPLGGMPLPVEHVEGTYREAVAREHAASSINTEDLSTYPASQRNMELGWNMFVDFAHAWTHNFDATMDIEVEESQPERDENGVIVQEPSKDNPKRGSGFAKQIKVKVTKTVAKPQPDRAWLMQTLGSGVSPIPVMKMAKAKGSLQRLVAEALQTAPTGAIDFGAMKHVNWDLTETVLPITGFSMASVPVGVSWPDYVERIAANMVQLCRFGFPDLAKAYDHTPRWRTPA